MHSFYINGKGIVFKLIDSKRGAYYQLNSDEIKSFLEKVGKAEINKVSFNRDTMQLIYDNDRVVIEGEFLDKESAFTTDLKERLIEAKDKREKQNIEAFKERFKGYVPSINRTKCKKMGALIVAGVLVLELVAPQILAYFFNKEKRKVLIDTKPSESVGLVLDGTEYKPNDSILDTTIYAELAFDDFTRKAINEDGESQLDVVTRNCSQYLDKYIDRYGLPSNVTYGMCTLEKGILDNHLESGDIINPMQINGMSGEYFSNVPVYKNGKLTGEYDSFYAFSKNDERIKEHPNDKILIIENVEDNFQIACAYFRRCIDRYKNIFIAIDAYNKGIYAFSNLYEKPLIEVPQSREYYQENFNDFSWTPLIAAYYKVKRDDPNFVYGDPNYIWDVLKHVQMGDRSSVMISYYYEGELIEVSLTNTNKLDNSVDSEYNSSLGR